MIHVWDIGISPGGGGSSDLAPDIDDVREGVAYTKDGLSVTGTLPQTRELATIRVTEDQTVVVITGES